MAEPAAGEVVEGALVAAALRIGAREVRRAIVSTTWISGSYTPIALPQCEQCQLAAASPSIACM
jgi:hypothetical protein